MGHFHIHQQSDGIRIGQKLGRIVLLVLLFLANTMTIPNTWAGSPGGGSTQAKISVGATILEYTNMKIISQTYQVMLTDIDINRGYVEIPLGSRLNIKSNNPHGYMLAFEVTNNPNNVFGSITVVINGKELQLSPSGGWITQPYTRGGVTTGIDYRFVLTKDAQPGIYGWPITISVNHM